MGVRSMQYNFSTWLLFFYIYCFFGWFIESTIVSFSEKRLINRGFMKGPVLPLYGSGAIIVLLLCLPYKSNPVIVYILGVVLTTILEYYTGFVMEAIFKIKYWDYSKNKFNYKGRICLSSSIFWGILVLILTYFVHGFVSGFVQHISNYIYYFLIPISIFFISDFLFSVYNVINLNKMLLFITNLKRDIESVVEQIKKETVPSENLEKLRKRFSELTTQYETKIKSLSFFNRQIFLSYPHARSKQFNKTVLDLKNKFLDKYRNK